VELAVIVLAFATIVVVELPDKTLIATLVLSTRYRPLFVWIGVGLAFAVQTGIAVALGTAAAFLPDVVVHGVALALFLVGAVMLLREAHRHGEVDQGEEYAERAGEAPGWRAIGRASWCSSPPSGETSPSC
jgi:putative Ca2+/H+ antiporter (TMEM165/GDT1 family)